MPDTVQPDVELVDVGLADPHHVDNHGAGAEDGGDLSPVQDAEDVNATSESNIPGIGSNAPEENTPPSQDHENENGAPEHNILAWKVFVEGRIEAIERRKQERRRSCLKKAGHISNIVLTIILSIVALFFGIYATYHFSKPANDIALESLKAAEWSNYYNWVWTICPVEQARNMTTPECEEAQNRTVPPPQKPDNFQVQSLSYRLARRLLPLINGSLEFESLMSDTDEICGFGNVGWNVTRCSEYTPWQSSQPNPSLLLDDRRSLDSHLIFPLPSDKLRGTRYHLHVSAKIIFLLIALQLVSNLVFLAYLSIIKPFKLWPLRSTTPSLSYRMRMWLYCIFTVALSMYTWATAYCYQIIYLAIWMSQDSFVDMCLTSKGLDDKPNSTRCNHIFEMSSNLDISDQARVWGIWRGFYFGRIRASTLADFPIIILIATSLLIFSTPIFIAPFIVRRRAVSSIYRLRARALVIFQRAARPQPVNPVDEEQLLIDFTED